MNDFSQLKSQMVLNIDMIAYLRRKYFGAEEQDLRASWIGREG